MGEAGPDVGLSVHVDNVAGLVREHDLHDAILVGASYGGPVISGVAAANPDRVRP